MRQKVHGIERGDLKKNPALIFFREGTHRGCRSLAECADCESRTVFRVYTDAADTFRGLIPERVREIVPDTLPGMEPVWRSDEESYYRDFWLTVQDLPHLDVARVPAFPNTVVMNGFAVLAIGAVDSLLANLEGRVTRKRLEEYILKANVIMCAAFRTEAVTFSQIVFDSPEAAAKYNYSVHRLCKVPTQQEMQECVEYLERDI